MSAKNVQVAIISLDLEEEVLGTIPPVNNLFNEVIVLAHAEADRALTLLAT